MEEHHEEHHEPPYYEGVQRSERRTREKDACKTDMTLTCLLEKGRRVRVGGEWKRGKLQGETGWQCQGGGRVGKSPERTRTRNPNPNG